MSQRARKEERDKTDQVFVRDADRVQRDPRGNSISGTSCERQRERESQRQRK